MSQKGSVASPGVFLNFGEITDIMPTISPSAKVHSATVTDRDELAPGIVRIGFDAPALASVTKPGQFVMVVPPSGEAAGTALGLYEADGRRASLVFFVVGPRTRELANLREGERLDLVGPLGNGFTLPPEARDVAIVAGGVGIASVLLPAQALVRAGARVRLLYGAKTHALLVEARRFQDEGCDVLLATDDGSAGHHGYVTDVLANLDPLPELILACGPSPMLRSVARVAAEKNVPAQLSLEETFACGVGGCWGCVVPLVRTSAQAPSFPPAIEDGSDVVYARICKEGPVFWAHEIRW
jgi:dihydroorotate dehydrogenase electron transfer subunit